MPIPHRLLFWASFFCLMLSLAMHALSFADVSFAPGIFLVPLLFVIWPLVVWQWRRLPRRNLVAEVFGALPRWMKWSAGVLLAYTFLNVFLCVSINSGGIPQRAPDGRLVLQRKEQILRELTPQEFRHAEAVQTRMLSGHLLVFYGLALVAQYAFGRKSREYDQTVKEGLQRLRSERRK